MKKFFIYNFFLRISSLSPVFTGLSEQKQGQKQYKINFPRSVKKGELEMDKETERILQKVRNGVPLRKILDVVLAVDGVTIEQVQSNRRFTEYADARKLFAALAISFGFMHRDICTVLHKQQCMMSYYIRKSEELSDLRILKVKLYEKITLECTAH